MKLSTIIPCIWKVCFLCCFAYPVKYLIRNARFLGNSIFITSEIAAGGKFEYIAIQQIFIRFGTPGPNIQARFMTDWSHTIFSSFLGAIKILCCPIRKSFIFSGAFGKISLNNCQVIIIILYKLISFSCFSFLKVFRFMIQDLHDSPIEYQLKTPLHELHLILNSWPFSFPLVDTDSIFIWIRICCLFSTSKPKQIFRLLVMWRVSLRHSWFHQNYMRYQIFLNQFSFPLLWVISCDSENQEWFPSSPFFRLILCLLPLLV